MEQIQNNRVMTDLYRENAQFPGIALDGSDVYLCWQRFVDRHDSLMASCRRGDEVVWEREISDGGEVLHPVILAHGGAIWYAWSEYARENWRILARCYRDGQWGEVLTVASGEAQIVPCALLFGFCDAVQIYLQGEAFPPQIVQMLPYIVTLLVLAFGVKHIKPPAGVGKYDDE